MNIAEKLAREIWRVGNEVMPIYEQIGVAGLPALSLMKASMEGACRAVGSNCAMEVLAALRDLEGYKK